jgi:ribonuclease P protein component
MKTIKSKKDFESVFTRGRRARTALVRIQILATQDKGDPTKVAFVAAKRLGNAVFRNRCKRMLREAVRLCGVPDTGYLVILYANRETSSATPAAIAADMGKGFRKLGVELDG